MPGTMTAAQFVHLASLDMDAVAQIDVDTIADFAQLWLLGQVSNQPVRMDSDSLKIEIGQAWFKDASAWWNSIR